MSHEALTEELLTTIYKLESNQKKLSTECMRTRQTVLAIGYMDKIPWFHTFTA